MTLKNLSEHNREKSLQWQRRSAVNSQLNGIALHPITPPPDLLKYWEEQHFDEGENYDVMLIDAYQEGADMELQACCKWIESQIGAIDPKDLLTARRPPSLQDQALDDLERISALLIKYKLPCDTENIRRALESLPS